MKKIFFILGALALMGLTTACVETQQLNPNFDAKTNSVNTNFVFNVATGNTPQTKQTAANTQADLSQDFRGIDNARLLGYKLGTANDGKIVSTATSADKTYNLGTVLPAGQLDPDGGGTSTPKSHRVLELDIPIETNALMFWGKAIKSGADADNEQGLISFNPGAADISTYSFSLTPRVASGSAGETMMKHYQDVVVKLLNAIVQTSFTAAANACNWGGVSNASAIDIAWSDYVTVSSSSVITAGTTEPYDGTAICELGTVLATAYKTLNTVSATEARSGAGESVVRTIADLYTVIHKVATAIPSTYNEYIATQVASAIETNILKVVDNTGAALAIGTLISNAGVSYTDMASALVDFPDAIADIALPKGSAQMKVTIQSTKPVATWSYLTDVFTGTTGSTHNIYKYTYPAELCYFGNSPIRVSDEEHTTAQYPDGAGTASGEWLNDASWTGWTTGHITSSTRSVAMLRNINYGTALLKTAVAWASGVTALQDNNAAIQLARTGETVANNSFATSNTLFTLTGILIGGQSKTVGWNYLPTAAFDHVIYDKCLVSGEVPTPTNSENYTLVWDNYSTSSTQDVVYVALEFVNNTGKDFGGKDNMIPKDGTFYLVGKLAPASATNTITWPANYAIPPYTTSGETTETARVFIQDYMTTATFVLNETSLQKAYLTVPDLRSTQLSLGLSVDLAWSTGLNFDSVVLGAE